MTKRIAAILALLGLAACGAPEADVSGRYATPIGGAPVIDNTTPYSTELACLRGEIDAHGQRKPRIAVGEIRDYTGKYDETNGAKITQGAALMAVSGVARLGLPMVERLDMRVAEAELKYANNNLIGDDGTVRQIRAASMQGSDYHIVGGITELNYNIRSTASDAFYSRLGARRQVYVLNIAVDLRLVDSVTLEVADVISYQKQIVGFEQSAGVFEFFGSNIFDISSAERSLEPMQLAVRAMIEKAIGEMARTHFGLPPELCAAEAPTAGPTPTDGAGVQAET
ncbi:holdfast anchoring protein HfaB [Alkalilacustris brevis]|uniref:holdfast anchoring protein HfaB n=1 Tax=Alkalilacustris brevis TaxID=2026338 RepID=UPI001EE3CACC|nr:holdfast anchoring protein HfaB [Alkalilacustris brevis]